MLLKPKEYRFNMDVYTPDTMPMGRLGEYMQRFATLLGHHQSVHFSRIESGSHILVAKVDPQDEPKVRDRVRRVRKRIGPKDAQDAYDTLDGMLRDDNAVAEVIEPDGDKVIQFPGRLKSRFDLIGPISERGTLDGIPVAVGGRNDPVPVEIQDADGTSYYCEAKRDLAKQIAVHLFERPIRINGLGRWFRDKSGKWNMKSFRIHDFEPLRSSGLAETIHRLRIAHQKSDWAKSEDPLAELEATRNE